MTIVNQFGENLNYAIYPSGTGVGPISEGTIQKGDTLVHDVPAGNYFVAFGSNGATPQPPVFSTDNNLTNNSTITLAVKG